ITGLDLVEWQLRVASGEALPMRQEALAITGHAVEARLYAEDPAQGFLPATGTLEALAFPEEEGVRIDTGVEEGDTVTPFYDPMIAKVIAHAPTRAEALEALALALCDTVVAGPKTNAAFLVRLLRDQDFAAGAFDTGLIDRKLDILMDALKPSRAAVALGGLRLVERKRQAVPRPHWATPFAGNGGFRLMPSAPLSLAVEVDGALSEIQADWDEDGLSVSYRGTPPTFVEGGDGATLVDLPDRVVVLEAGRSTTLTWPSYRIEEDVGTSDEAVSPMTGRIVEIAVAPGAQVKKGDRLFIVEAMKMEHSVSASRAAVIAAVHAAAGEQVNAGAVILRFEPEEDA
ncbi:MAG: carbamoyl-phosphate synthase subunit L, partial [Hyphomicrobiaceae bacterium]|nr:carbamoyl-phosphate synthase subunit L [Hyphomicrobiaceae bacterium]